MLVFVILIESLSGHLTVLSNFYDVYIFVLEPEYFIPFFHSFFLRFLDLTVFIAYFYCFLLKFLLDILSLRAQSEDIP